MARTNGYVYRDYRKGRSGNKKRRFSLSLLIFIVDIIMAVALFATAVATIICSITPNNDPASLGIISTVALAAPIIYVIMLCVLFYWIVRWKWSLVVVTLVFVIIGSFSAGKYYRIYFKQPISEKYPSHLKVVSYNICNLNRSEIVDSLANHAPNIVCLQEYKSDSGFVWNNVGAKHRYKKSRQINTTAKGEADFSCEIFTNLPIIRQGLIDSLPRFNAIWADILYDKDTIRVVNLHLKSTTITAQDMEFVEGHKYVLDSARNSKIRSITDRLVENSIYRGAQARKVKEFIERSQPMKIIVCGDFNDTPLSYTYKTIAQQLTDTFIAAGNGYRYTFNGFFKLLPIDYILASKHFNVLSYEADYTMGFSDHYPVITRMRINKD